MSGARAVSHANLLGQRAVGGTTRNSRAGGSLAMGMRLKAGARAGGLNKWEALIIAVWGDGAFPALAVNSSPCFIPFSNDDPPPAPDRRLDRYSPGPAQRRPRAALGRAGERPAGRAFCPHPAVADLSQRPRLL